MKKILIIIVLALIIFLGFKFLVTKQGVSNNRGDIYKFKINEINNSGRRGEVTITQTEADPLTQIIIKLSGSPEDTPELATLHEGTCEEEFGSSLWPLTSVVNGESKTVLEIPLEALMSEAPFALKIFEGFEPEIELLACSNVVLFVNKYLLPKSVLVNHTNFW